MNPWKLTWRTLADSAERSATFSHEEDARGLFGALLDCGFKVTIQGPLPSSYDEPSQLEIDAAAGYSAIDAQ